MTIDERLEALGQSMELLASFHKDHEEQFARHQRENEEYKRRLAAAIESIAETNRRLEENDGKLMENDRKLSELIAGMGEGQRELRDAIMRLSIIAEAHQDTLDDHDKRLGV